MGALNEPAWIRERKKRAKRIAPLLSISFVSLNIASRWSLPLGITRSQAGGQAAGRPSAASAAGLPVLRIPHTHTHAHTHTCMVYRRLSSSMYTTTREVLQRLVLQALHLFHQPSQLRAHLLQIRQFAVQLLHGVLGFAGEIDPKATIKPMASTHRKKIEEHVPPHPPWSAAASSPARLRRLLPPPPPRPSAPS